MENRAPISVDHGATHIVPFKKLSQDHARRLIEAYLSGFRIKKEKANRKLFPFTEEVVELIALDSELNASKILKSAYELMERAIEDDQITTIGPEFFKSIYHKEPLEEKPQEIITNTGSIDLLKKAEKS